MSKLHYLNPLRIHSAVRDIRRVFGDGGPSRVRLAGIDHPAGWILPSSTMTIEVIGRDGRVERFCPELPVPFPYAWAWRIARVLGVPLVRAADPRRLRVSVPVPRGRGSRNEREPESTRDEPGSPGDAAELNEAVDRAQSERRRQAQSPAVGGRSSSATSSSS